MGRIPEETVENVLAATDIVAVVESYLPLKRAGSLFKANCPFHNEKTPSFTVNPARQAFKCFGCGESGSAIGFVMRYENLPFPEALKKLAGKVGVRIEEEAYDPESERRRHRSTRLKELHNRAADYYHSLLLGDPAASHARAYMKGRGFGKETADEWLIGWAPGDSKKFLTWAKEAGFSGRELIDSGLCGQRDENNTRSGLFTRFYDRLMFPVHNDYGDVVGFSARQLREDPRSGKYINTPETAIFKKSKLLFALHKARKAVSAEKYALLCEGQLDVIACHEAGCHHAVAGLGTAFTEDHARLLKRYTDHVTICFDGDSAGLEAAGKAFVHLAKAGLPVKLALLPEGDDPDTFLKKNGAEAFRKLLAEAHDFFTAKLDQELAANPLNNPTEKAEFLKKLSFLVSQVSDQMAREATIQQLATRLRLSADAFRQSVHEAGRQANRFNRPEKETGPARPEPSPMDPIVAYLCHLALTSSEAADLLGEQLETLYEILEETPGGKTLQRILGRRPDPTKPSVILAYLATLPLPDQLALASTFTTDAPSNPVQATTETISHLLSSHFQKKESALRSILNDPNLDLAELPRLQREVKELHAFFENLRNRFIR